MLRHLDYFRDLLDVSNNRIDLACGVFPELAHIQDDFCRLPINAAPCNSDPYQKLLNGLRRD